MVKKSYLNVKYLYKLNHKNNLKKKPVYLMTRNSTILPSYIELNFKFNNEKIFNQIKITESKVGYKFGEFSPTRVRFVFKKKRKKEKRKKI